MSNKILGRVFIMIFSIKVSWLNYILAVTVICKRLVLWIFNKFKKY